MFKIRRNTKTIPININKWHFRRNIFWLFCAISRNFAWLTYGASIHNETNNTQNRYPDDKKIKYMLRVCGIYFFGSPNSYTRNWILPKNKLNYPKKELNSSMVQLCWKGKVEPWSNSIVKIENTWGFEERKVYKKAYPIEENEILKNN